MKKVLGVEEMTESKLTSANEFRFLGTLLDNQQLRLGWKRIYQALIPLLTEKNPIANQDMDYSKSYEHK